MYLQAANWFANGRQQLGRDAQDLADRSIQWYRNQVPTLRRLQGLPSWEHVTMVHVWTTGDLRLVLHPDHQDSPLPREIAQEFHVTGRKELGHRGLQVTYQIPMANGFLPLAVMGYIPATCLIVETEEHIPAHVGKVRKVVCSETAK